MPSYYEALPIYKVAMDVAVRVDAVVQRFAKGHKYTLGGRLRETTLDVVMLLRDATAAPSECDSFRCCAIGSKS
jgi:hypothetical protein